MAQVNHNIDYINIVDGLTIWEKLRVIRNFLQDRRIALQLAELEPNFDGMSNKERKVYEITKPQLIANIQNAKEEIAFLEQFEAELTKAAEATRIPGKTDNEMYEINYQEELIQKHVLEVTAQLIANGKLDTNTVKTLIQNPQSLSRVIELRLLPKDIKAAIPVLSEQDKIKEIGVSSGIPISYSTDVLI